MEIPVFTEMKYVQETGFLTEEMLIYNDQLNQALQGGLSNNGWTTPNILPADLTSVAPSMPNGTFWYDETNNEIVFKVNGSLVKLLTAAYP